MLHLSFGNVKEGQMRDFQAWVKKNEGAMSKHAPPGWLYRGTYACVYGFGPSDMVQLWEIGRYGDLDAGREHADKEWDRLQQEMTEFFEPHTTVPAVLLREIGDTKIIEPAKKPKK